MCWCQKSVPVNLKSHIVTKNTFLRQIKMKKFVILAILILSTVLASAADLSLRRRSTGEDAQVIDNQLDDLSRTLAGRLAINRGRSSAIKYGYHSKSAKKYDYYGHKSTKGYYDYYGHGKHGHKSAKKYHYYGSGYYSSKSSSGKGYGKGKGAKKYKSYGKGKGGKKTKNYYGGYKNGGGKYGSGSGYYSSKSYKGKGYGKGKGGKKYKSYGKGKGGKKTKKYHYHGGYKNGYYEEHYKKSKPSHSRSHQSRSSRSGSSKFAFQCLLFNPLDCRHNLINSLCTACIHFLSSDDSLDVAAGNNKKSNSNKSNNNNKNNDKNKNGE